MTSHALERSSPDTQKRLKKTYFYFFYFFISISFAVKLQARLFWWVASGPPRDKMCVFMNLLQFFCFFFPPILHLLHQSLSGELFGPSIFSVCISFKQLELELLKIQSNMYLTHWFISSPWPLLHVTPPSLFPCLLFTVNCPIKVKMQKK